MEQSSPLPLLAEGARSLGVELQGAELRRLSIFSQELVAWNEQMNLTAVTNPIDVQMTHFLDALTVVPVVREELPRGGRLIDVGAGAGLPGLVLAIVLPRLEVALLEATAKKIRFLRYVIDILETGNARPVPGRAEQLAHDDEHREAYDIATARAVGSIATLVELLIPLVKVEGLAVLMKTRASLDGELPEARGALDRLHAAVEDVRSDAAPGIEGHVLILIRKHGSTPREYPRRPGVPARRPLGR